MAVSLSAIVYLHAMGGGIESIFLRKNSIKFSRSIVLCHDSAMLSILKKKIIWIYFAWQNHGVNDASHFLSRILYEIWRKYRIYARRLSNVYAIQCICWFFWIVSYFALVVGPLLTIFTTFDRYMKFIYFCFAIKIKLNFIWRLKCPTVGCILVKNTIYSYF